MHPLTWASNLAILAAEDSPCRVSILRSLTASSDRGGRFPGPASWASWSRWSWRGPTGSDSSWIKLLVLAASSLGVDTLLGPSTPMSCCRPINSWCGNLSSRSLSGGESGSSPPTAPRALVESEEQWQVLVLWGCQRIPPNPPVVY